MRIINPCTDKGLELDRLDGIAQFRLGGVGHAGEGLYHMGRFGEVLGGMCVDCGNQVYVFGNDVVNQTARLRFRQRHIVKPGLTGWAQINYPYGNTIEDALQKLQYDLFYIKNQSFLFDLSILFNTVKTVVMRKGT